MIESQKAEINRALGEQAQQSYTRKETDVHEHELDHSTNATQADELIPQIYLVFDKQIRRAQTAAH